MSRYLVIPARDVDDFIAEVADSVSDYEDYDYDSSVVEEALREVVDRWMNEEEEDSDLT